MIIKWGMHPSPGLYKDRLVTADTQSVGSIRKKHTTTAASDQSSMMGGDNGGMYGGSSASVDRYNPIRDRLDEGSVIEDWLPRDAAGLDKMFRLMYHRCPIAGPIVDLLADLIWSDWSLMGVNDPAIKKVFEDTMSAINPTIIGPDTTREFLVLGRSISSLIFNQSKGIFTDLISHDPDFVRITPIPIRGFDPKIDLIPSPAFRAFVESNDPRDLDAKKILPEAYLKAMRAAGGGSGGGNLDLSRSSSQFGLAGGHTPGGIPLDPINTMFTARKVFNYDNVGTSLYTRLISFWALEKALINATVTSARRRSRAILHVKVGLDNLWEPTAEEIDNIAGMFIQADDDPIGAVVATRSGVEAVDVKSGTDFYKWSDEWELLTQGKLRALGANEALLSGEATYSNQEAAIGFFMERAAALRDMLTLRMYYNKIFKLTARLHGFRKISKAHLDHNIRVAEPRIVTADTFGEENIKSTLTQREALKIPDSELITPTIQWHKDLVNRVDTKKLEIYDKMEEKGIPITMRNWTSAANIDLDGQLADLEDDLAIRQKIIKWKKYYENPEAALMQDYQNEILNEMQNEVQSKLKEVVGSLLPDLGPLKDYPFWTTEFTFGKVSPKEIAEIIHDINPESNKVFALYDYGALIGILNNKLRNIEKCHAAHYLLYRNGLTTVKPRLPAHVIAAMVGDVEKSLDRYANCGKIYKLGQVAQKEMDLIVGLSENNQEKTAEKIGKIADKVYKSKDQIPKDSNKLFAGKE